MAKNNFLKKFKHKEKSEEIETFNKKSEKEETKEEMKEKPKEKNKLSILQKLINLGAYIVNACDEIQCEIDELAQAGGKGIITVCAAAVTGYDKIADLVGWFTSRTFVLVARKAHDNRVFLNKYRKKIAKYGLGVLVVAVGMVALFASVIEYEYSYNGKALGLVHEQRDVLEILDLVSEELSQEYGSSISIDPETDITFKPVIANGRDIDDADTVLKKFTYMGDIQAQAYAIKIDGNKIVTVESKAVADEVLQAILNSYVDPDDVDKYEYIGFAEEVEVEAYNTTLARISSKSAAIKKIKSGAQQELTYKVQAGDTLYGICSSLGVSINELKKMNPKLSEDSTLHVGDTIITEQEIPLITVETVKISTFAETLDYETEYKESDSYYEGDKVVTREGKKGKAKITARLTQHNGVTVEREDLSKEIITEPVNKIVVKGTKKVPPKKGTGSFIRPVNVAIYRGYGMRWGRMHQGVDLAASTGTPIRAADGGTVIMAGWYGGYGYCIKIDHGGNTTTLYGHCNTMSVSVGDKVYQGQTIGTVGNTGNSTGPHCHFEIKINGVHVNPANYI